MLAVFTGSLAIAPVQALDPLQKRVFNDNVLYFNYKADDGNQACAGAAGGAANLNVGKDFNLGGDGRTRRINLIKALMADFQFTAEQAAGIVGNFMHESGGQDLPPDVNEGGAKGPPRFRGGYGWAQWTGSRQRAFIDFAVQNGYMPAGAPATDAANYAWLKQELATSHKATVPAVKAATTVEQAVINFEREFERAGVPAIAIRTTYARQALNEFNGGGGGPGGTAGGASPQQCGGSAAIVGNTAFPLVINKGGIKNRGIFANGTTNVAGHPYTAYDILVNPGVEVVAFMSGTVMYISEDRCPGRMVSIHNPESDITVSYLHLAFDNHVAAGATVQVGQHVGVVGPASAGCGTPHLHIDAARGNRRPGCSRLNCPPANSSRFVDIGPQLFTTYQALPE
jgi:hypothetical protein